MQETANDGDDRESAQTIFYQISQKKIRQAILESLGWFTWRVLNGPGVAETVAYCNKLSAMLDTGKITKDLSES